MKLFKEVIPYIVIIVVVVLLRTFVITPVMVDGTSMMPTLHDNDVLLLKKYDNSFDRFDIVVLKYNNEKLVKRVIGLPGEHVKYVDNKLFINNDLIVENFSHEKTDDFNLEYLGYDTIPDGYYFVLGDNRTDSMDSRIIGLVSKKDIIGITDFSLFPFSRFGKI